MAQTSEHGDLGRSVAPHHLSSDRPLTDPADDRLGRRSLAQQLAGAILRLDARDGFVVALNGDWGSGKTTLLNFLLHDLKETGQDRVLIVRFNPWRFSGTDDLVAQFFSQLSSALRRPDTPGTLKSIGAKLDRVAGIIAPFKFVPGLGELAEAGKEVIQGAGATLQKAGEAMQRDLEGQRAALDDALREQTARIIVVIDDIDRLRAEEIRQVFQLVKVVADFPNTVYLLAFDDDLVARSLAGVQPGDGREYLEKIVQAPIRLPAPDRPALDALLFAQLDEVLGGTPADLFDHQRWSNLFLTGLATLVQTPRDVNRLINVLRLEYPLVTGEVNAVDFIAMVALRVFATGVYDFVAANEATLAGPSDPGARRDAQPEALRPAFETVLATVPKTQRDAVHEILSRVFPRWASAFGGSLYGRDWLPQWRRERRICSPDDFATYFRLALAPSDLGAGEMTSLLQLAPNRAAFGATLVRLAREDGMGGGSRLEVFLRRLEDRSALTPAMVRPILAALFEVGDELLELMTARGSWSPGRPSPQAWLVWFVRQLLETLPSQADRFHTLAEEWRTARALLLRALTVAALHRDQADRAEADRATRTEPLLATDQIACLVQSLVDDLRAAMRTDEPNLRGVPDAPALLGIMLALAEDRAAAEVEVREHSARLVGSDEGLAGFLAALADRSVSWGDSDVVGRVSWRLRREAIATFLEADWAMLARRCGLILTEAPPWLTVQQRGALEALVALVAGGTDADEPSLGTDQRDGTNGTG